MTRTAQKMKYDLPNGDWASVAVLVDPLTGLAYGGTAGGGNGAEDLLFTDDAGVQFVYRDNGAVPPVFTAYRVPTGAAYTVGANPRPYAVRDAIITSSALPTGAATSAKQDTLNALLAKGQGTAAQSVSVVLSSDGPFATNFGVQADARAAWYTSVASHVSLLKLLVAAFVNAGSHVYTYSGGFLVTDAWTFLGTTYTKTYGNDGSNITTVTDWV